MNEQTHAGLPSTMFARGSDTFVADSVTYLSGAPLTMIVPFLAFGTIAVISCTVWSCGMLKCCTDGTNGPRCFGKCCAKPPSFTRGNGAWAWTLITLATGATIVIVASRALAINAEQNEAIQSISGSFEVLDTWASATFGTFNTTADTLDDLISEVGSLNGIFNSMTNEQMKDLLKLEVDSLPSTVAQAKESMEGVVDLLANLDSTLSNLRTNTSVHVDSFNAARGSAVVASWVVLCILMVFEIVVALLRRLVPEKTTGSACNYALSTLTCSYITIMLAVFVLTSLLALVTMIAADVCVDPDGIFGIIVGTTASAVSASAGESAGVDLQAVTGDGSASRQRFGREIIGDGAIGPDLLGYFFTCDTNAEEPNPFNVGAADVLVHLASANAELALMADYFIDFEARMAFTLIENDETAKASYLDDKMMFGEALAGVQGSIGTISTALSGESDPLSVDWTANHGQGLTTGSFSALNCYQVNARYNALVNVICTYTFSTFARMLEYSMAAAILMVLVQWAKQWSQPWPAPDVDAPEDGDIEGSAAGKGSAITEQGQLTPFTAFA